MDLTPTSLYLLSPNIARHFRLRLPEIYHLWDRVIPKAQSQVRIVQRHPIQQAFSQLIRLSVLQISAVILADLRHPVLLPECREKPLEYNADQARKAAWPGAIFH